MRLLIVEDDLIQSLSLKIQLNNIGYNDITVANDFTSLKSLVNDKKYDLVFCDIKMPEIDGIELLLEYITPQNIPNVVIVSAVEETVIKLTKGMCNQIGYQYVGALKKPYNSEDLEKELSNIIASKNRNGKASLITFLNEEDILDAFFHKYFFCEYQPQFSFRSGKLVGIETLARLDHPEYGVVYPSQFLGLIDRMGLVERFYTYVLEQSSADVAFLNESLRVSVNVPPSLLLNPIYKLTERVCNKSDMKLSRLTIELTEDGAFLSSKVALANLAKLSLKGVRFSVDDFGTGYASLEQLLDLPISELKIDKRFIGQVTTDYRLQQLTKASVQLAQSLGIDCVAEGVETSETWEYLRELGVDTCQGYYTGAPMKISEIKLLNDVIYKQDNELLDGMEKDGCILIYDENDIRGLALSRMLQNKITTNMVKHVNSINELEIYLGNKNNLVNLIIIETDSINDMNRANISSLLSSVGKVLSLVSGESKLCDNDLIGMKVVKSHSLIDTAKNVIETIVVNNASSLSTSKIKFSKRELEVAKLLLAGFTNKYISYELGISQKTVSTFKRRILSKAGIKSIVELSQLFLHHRQ